MYEDLYLPISLPRRSAACRRYPATKIDESLRAFLKVRTETFDVLRLQLDVRLKNDIRGPALVIEEAPASGLQQQIDF
ncbi:hypothetical protein [Agrobacterium tumefaciens]|uniref:hypothetical protein n=1 Tax=Agrobacterium tumefaciens TaxID=358 RepID=UPI0013A69B14|nr:hypothetical protein [Agrobacterium tumefaciens]MDP9790888.1 hypothetical protein [Agrobacterium tumefaciens]